ncbi:thioredoxin 1 [Chryseobacterium ginsenosidimutans]|jgi:thioredoxin 1|uniref:thioredoxin n=1 Tax=Chryseobacterium ginsenosidimutans TaxID=687846 RepID=UPI0021683FF2|nr:thioredoxin [Chryseobacterium ginsenosidimutans]MCS3868710.1 thioredoxin 1 [Chryseobacterium ginsenosidimutans]
MALEITDSSFAEILSKSKEQPVLVDFWAVWCGPCRTLGPIIEEVANDFEGKAVVGKVDVDNNQEISMKYGIRNIPTVLIFRNGEVVDKIVGVSPKEVIAEKLSAHL